MTDTCVSILKTDFNLEQSTLEDDDFQLIEQLYAENQTLRTMLNLHLDSNSEE